MKEARVHRALDEVKVVALRTASEILEATDHDLDDLKELADYLLKSPPVLASGADKGEDTPHLDLDAEYLDDTICVGLDALSVLPVGTKITDVDAYRRFGVEVDWFLMVNGGNTFTSAMGMPWTLAQLEEWLAEFDMYIVLNPEHLNNTNNNIEQD